MPLPLSTIFSRVSANLSEGTSPILFKLLESAKDEHIRDFDVLSGVARANSAVAERRESRRMPDNTDFLPMTAIMYAVTDVCVVMWSSICTHLVKQLFSLIAAIPFQIGLDSYNQDTNANGSCYKT